MTHNSKKSAKERFISGKIKKIYAEGIRGKPPASNAQAVAMAESYARKKA